MTEKIIDYRTVSSPEQARKVIKDFENTYHRDYDWNCSHGEIEDAVAVCVLETERGYRCITTTKSINYIERRQVVKAINIGDL